MNDSHKKLQSAFMGTCVYKNVDESTDWRRPETWPPWFDPTDPATWPSHIVAPGLWEHDEEFDMIYPATDSREEKDFNLEYLRLGKIRKTHIEPTAYWFCVFRKEK